MCEHMPEKVALRDAKKSGFSEQSELRKRSNLWKQAMCRHFERARAPAQPVTVAGNEAVGEIGQKRQEPEPAHKTPRAAK